MNAPEPIRRLSRGIRLLGMTTLLALAAALPATALAARAATPAATPTVCTTLTCIVQFGDARIAERLTALGTLSGKIATDLSNKLISSTQASALQGDVSTNVNGLTTLKGQIDAFNGQPDTPQNRQAARALVKQIFLTYRVFAVVLPRDYRELEFDIIFTADQYLRSLDPIIQSAIDNAPAGEQAKLNSLFSDYKAQLTEAESQIDAAQGQLPALTPANFNNDPTLYKTALTDYSNDVRAAHQGVRKAAQDLHQIAQILKSSGAAAITTPTP